jgi:hypothetical protein
VRIKRVSRVRTLGTGHELRYWTRCSIIDQFANKDPNGELTITVPAAAIDDLATVIKVEFAAAAAGGDGSGG